METINIRLPNGSVVQRELENEEISYWVSLGMYLAHGFHAISTIYAAEQMDDEATINVDPPQEQSVN